MSASRLEYFGSQRKANNVKPGVQILTLEITTLKIQSDCFSIKRSRKRPTDCSFQLTLPIYYHTRRWNVIKDSKFQPSLVDKKVFKMWVLPGTSYPVQYSGLHFAGVEDFNIHSGKSWIFMTLLWVTEHSVMGRLIETMKINVSMWKIRS